MSPAGAAHVLDRIEEAFTGLSEHPLRGGWPKELLDIGIREYREVFFKPYRIIYRVMNENVYVLVIADGRRDMRTLLERRLLLAITVSRAFFWGCAFCRTFERERIPYRNLIQCSLA